LFAHLRAEAWLSFPLVSVIVLGGQGDRYRRTTDEMRCRVVAAIEARLDVALEVAGKLPENPASDRRRRGYSDRHMGADQGR
jgi:hypothetical protein